MGIDMLQTDLIAIIGKLKTFSRKSRRNFSQLTIKSDSSKGSIDSDSPNSFHVLSSGEVFQGVDNEELEMSLVKWLTTLEVLGESAAEAVGICDDLLQCNEQEYSTGAIRTQTVAITTLVDDVIQPLKFQV